MRDRVAMLKAAQAKGERPEFLFFYGHSRRPGLGPWILSQWWPSPFTHDGVTYPTAEHWMMAQKALIFDDPDAHAAILDAPTPAQAKKLGRTVRGFDERRWAALRSGVVRTGSQLKFLQNEGFRDWILATGDRILVEASPTDRIWGIGVREGTANLRDVRTWRGKNLLGFALTDARERLRAEGAGIAPDEVAPPWRAFPSFGANPGDGPSGPEALCWRMGDGEAHMIRFQAWWSRLPLDAKYAYELRNPPTGAWSSFFDEP